MMKLVAQLLSLVALMQFTSLQVLACSVCKVTVGGRTYFGNNEDSWRLGSKIWFENKNSGQFGAVYVGYSDNFPQGGMNEAGLAFDGLTIAPKIMSADPTKKTETSSTKFLKDIMQNCATVEEVRNYAIKFNRPFNNGVLFFADRTGKYLVMEPDTITIGNDAQYIIANFCPSTTSEKQKLNFERYMRGRKFLSNHVNDTSSTYCLALVDTMHECRRKIGDGTMYSSIADLQEGSFTLYFYHDFKYHKEFNLKAELAKGNHSFIMTEIFPPSPELKRLLDFKTPQNNFGMRLFLIFCEALFSFSAIFFLVGSFKRKTNIPKKRLSSYKTKLVLFSLSAVLLYYANVLLKNKAIFYFPSPYQDWKFSMLTIAAYIPFLLPILTVSLIIQNVRIFRAATWTSFSKYLFALNNLTYLALIFLFSYWKLYTFF